MTETNKQGFRALTPERQREIASAGGKAAHRAGRAHQWNPESARLAGLKGAAAKAAKREQGDAL